MLQAYETFDDAVPMIRGRLDIPAQIGRRAGLALPAQVIFDEYTVDTAENQLLLSASLRLLALPSLNASNRVAIMNPQNLGDKSWAPRPHRSSGRWS